MNTLEPINASRTINFPHDALATEFEIQAAIFSRLVFAGIHVRGEVNWADKKTRQHCRFDLVVYKDRKPIRIIEVKARTVRHRNGVENTRQGRRYRMYGIPVTFIYGIEDCDDLIRELNGV